MSKIRPSSETLRPETSDAVARQWLEQRDGKTDGDKEFGKLSDFARRNNISASEALFASAHVSRSAREPIVNDASLSRVAALEGMAKPLGFPLSRAALIFQRVATDDDKAGDERVEQEVAAQLARIKEAQSGKLPPGGWAKVNHEVLGAWIQGLHARMAKAPNFHPAVIFDWDNTSIYKDVGDASFRWQLEHLDFKVDVEQFEKLMPPDSLYGTTMLEGGVTLKALREDIVASYAKLYPLIREGKLFEAMQTDAYQDFRAKTMWLYQKLDDSDTIGAKYAYPWVTHFFQGFTAAEAQEVGRKACDSQQRERVGKDHWQAVDAGRAGRLGTDIDHGLRPQAENIELMHVLQGAGVHVYVCTASLQPLVQGAAQAFGYPVASDHFLGMRLEEGKDGKFAGQSLANYPLPYRQGKHDLIHDQVEVAAGKQVVGVCGDSNTDFEMLTQFKSCEMNIVWNRNKKDKPNEIGSLYPKALSDFSQFKPGDKFILLQGRDENTGLADSRRETIQFGEQAPTALGR